eukprot:6588126-Prymnesium_polylepis.1
MNPGLRSHSPFCLQEPQLPFVSCSTQGRSDATSGQLRICVCAQTRPQSEFESPRGGGYDAAGLQSELVHLTDLVQREQAERRATRQAVPAGAFRPGIPPVADERGVLKRVARLQQRNLLGVVAVQPPEPSWTVVAVDDPQRAAQLGVHPLDERFARPAERRGGRAADLEGERLILVDPGESRQLR